MISVILHTKCDAVHDPIPLCRISDAIGDSETMRWVDVVDPTRVDLYRELLASALDSYLSMSSNRLNLVMRRLTVSPIILMAMTLVTVGASLAIAPSRNVWL